MPATNTSSDYGSIAKAFHWLTAMLILTIIPIGIVADNLADQIKSPDIVASDQTVYWTTFLFSTHKTLGVIVFFIALARIIWAVTQTKPGLLNGDHKAEAWLAETIHWLLYGSLVIVPLSGWVHHAATTGFAPIWWPFGQGLPFVPKSAAVAEWSGTLHYIFQWVLVASIAMHIAGALKHHILDKDATLRRMLPGHTSSQPTASQPSHTMAFFTALTVWMAALGAAAGLGWLPLAEHSTTPQSTQLASTNGDWQVQEGNLRIEIKQLGSVVAGSFAEWSADINFDEQADENGKHGDVVVNIAIASLTLGSVTGQAMGSDFFDEAAFPEAEFRADIIAIDDALIAKGTLTIRDQTVPVEFPFNLDISDSLAPANATLSLDRRDFQIGRSVSDEGSLEFSVLVAFDLTAKRLPHQ